MTLRPGVAARVVFFVLALALFVLCVGALLSNPIVGAIGIAIFGFALVNASFRLFHPRSYATVLADDGFRVHDWRGRVVHDVAWSELSHLTVFHGNGLRGPGTSLFLAWRCAPRHPGPGRQPWSGGGTNAMGEAFDGALPSSYLGPERMLELFKERAERAHVAGHRAPQGVGDIRLEPF